MTQWFASDHHFWHDNIIEYGGRPFKDSREMNDALVSYHNDLVKPEDHVSFLGDVTLLRGGRDQKELFCRLIRSMHGHKRLYLGNHDHFPIQTYIDAGFEKVYATWRHDNGIIFSHIAIHPRSMMSAKANVHGHNHQLDDYDPVIQVDTDGDVVRYKPYLNISVERTDYKPITLEEIQSRLDRRRGEWEGVKIGLRDKLQLVKGKSHV